jgi:hypothetical protein
MRISDAVYDFQSLKYGTGGQQGQLQALIRPTGNVNRIGSRTGLNRRRVFESRNCSFQAGSFIWSNDRI